jgi:hypothetical protein
VTKEWAVEKCTAFWRQSDFWINMPSPYQIYAENFRPERRLRRSVNIWLVDAPEGTVVDLQLGVSRDDGLIPNAPPLSDLKVEEDESEAAQAIWSFWAFLASAAEAHIKSPSPVQTPLTTCPRCGTPTLPDARYCGNCGAALASG